MSKTADATSLINRFALNTNLQALSGHYRSKIFTPPTNGNPLITTASPIFSLLERINSSDTLPPIADIRDSIQHELYALQSRLVGKKYADEFIMIALYLISGTIDEILGKSHLRIHSMPAVFKAFTPTSKDDKGPETIFFEIVEQLKKNANQYLDLLELAYYCLITGFEGEMHFKADGRQKLDNIIEELFQLIQKNREHPPVNLFVKSKSPVPKTMPTKSLLTTALLSIGIISALFIFSHNFIEHKALTLVNKFSHNVGD